MPWPVAKTVNAFIGHFRGFPSAMVVGLVGAAPLVAAVGTVAGALTGAAPTVLLPVRHRAG